MRLLEDAGKRFEPLQHYTKTEVNLNYFSKFLNFRVIGHYKRNTIFRILATRLALTKRNFSGQSVAKNYTFIRSM